MYNQPTQTSYQTSAEEQGSTLYNQPEQTTYQTSGQQYISSTLYNQPTQTPYKTSSIQAASSTMYTPFATTPFATTPFSTYGLPKEQILQDLQQKQMFKSITTPFLNNNTQNGIMLEMDSNQFVKNQNVNADIF